MTISLFSTFNTYMVFFLNLTNTTTYLYVQKSGSLAKNEIIQFRLKWNVNLEFLQIPHGVIFFFFVSGVHLVR